jgi:hypothetical protein
MYLSLSDIDVALARHREVIANAECAWLLECVPRSRRRIGVNRVRQSAGAALVRIGERLQGCTTPCGPEPAR